MINPDYLDEKNLGSQYLIDRFDIDRCIDDFMDNLPNHILSYVMKISGGRVNPKIVQEKINERI